MINNINNIIIIEGCTLYAIHGRGSNSIQKEFPTAGETKDYERYFFLSYIINQSILIITFFFSLIIIIIINDH